MKRIILYIATSLNGKIARADGSVDWLDAIPNPDKSDYGYSAFYKSIDTTIMGYNTYDQVIGWGIDFPYPDKKNYVLTRKRGLIDTEFVEFVQENHLDFIRQLKNGDGGDIWLVGGGQVNTLLLNAGLIDEILMYVMPVVIPDGINLFEGAPNENLLQLTGSRTFASGVVELNYNLERPSDKSG